MNQTEGVVDSKMHFHAEVLLAACPGQVHFRIPLAAFVIGETGGRNDSGIDNAAFTQRQVVFLRVLVHLFGQADSPIPIMNGTLHAL